MIIYSSKNTESPFLQLNSTWDGKMTVGPNYRISKSARTLKIETSWTIPPYRYALHPVGSYVEGLWHVNVLEIFLLNKTQNIYQEFHIAPGGLWWSHAFDKPRSRIGNFTPPHVSVDYKETESSWSASLDIDLNSLTVQLSEQVYGNVTAYYGKDPTLLLSLVRLQGATPNFHQPELFSLVETVG